MAGLTVAMEDRIHRTSRNSHVKTLLNFLKATDSP